MNDVDATETEQWRLRDRHLQGLSSCRQRRAQAVVDVAESAKQLANRRGTDPLDDLLELYRRVLSSGAKAMVADSLSYVKTEIDLVKPVRAGGIAFDSHSRWPNASTVR